MRTMCWSAVIVCVCVRACVRACVHVRACVLREEIPGVKLKFTHVCTLGPKPLHVHKVRWVPSSSLFTQAFIPIKVHVKRAIEPHRAGLELYPRTRTWARKISSKRQRKERKAWGRQQNSSLPIGYCLYRPIGKAQTQLSLDCGDQDEMWKVKFNRSIQ